MGKPSPALKAIMRKHALSLPMADALLAEHYSNPQFTVLLNHRSGTLAALKRRGLIERMLLTKKGRDVAHELRLAVAQSR